jgi:hypothetical protein
MKPPGLLTWAKAPVESIFVNPPSNQQLEPQLSNQDGNPRHESSAIVHRLFATGASCVEFWNDLNHAI